MAYSGGKLWGLSPPFTREIYGFQGVFRPQRVLSPPQNEKNSWTRPWLWLVLDSNIYNTNVFNPFWLIFLYIFYLRFQIWHTGIKMQKFSKFLITNICFSMPNFDPERNICQKRTYTKQNRAETKLFGSFSNFQDKIIEKFNESKL